MSDAMVVSIGTYDDTSKSVPVTFTYNQKLFTRDVNAVLDTDGTYDAVATAAAVKTLTPTVAVKMDLMIVTTTPVTSE